MRDKDKEEEEEDEGLSEDAAQSMLHDGSAHLSWALQSLNHNLQRKTCLSRLHHVDMICQG